MNRVFSHRPRFDERSRAWGIGEGVGTFPRRSKVWACTTWLDQGQEGACTGFATAHWRAAKPRPDATVDNVLAFALYARAKELDEWPGEDYDGSSVLAAVKAARERGWVRSFRWAFGEKDLALALGYHGPAVLGVPWLEGMEDVDDEGYVHATGRVMGGHAILCTGYDDKHKRYLLHNSWGRKWGRNGKCWVALDDMRKLLAMEGEACVPWKK